jgi:heme/copper-type cytochrome/quinol oxidase subunit 1
MKKLWAILIWGVLVFGIGTYLDKVREMLMTGGDPFMTYVIRFGMGLVLAVLVVVAGRWTRRGAGGMGPGEWFVAGAVAWLLQAGYMWWMEPKRTLDLLVHDTFFVIYYPHVAVGVAVVFGVIGVVYLSYPSVTGRSMSGVLGRLHFWVSLAALYVVLWMVSYKYVSSDGTWGFEFRSFREWQTSQVVGWAYTGLTGLFVAVQVLFAGNLVGSLFGGRRRRGVDGRFR